MKRRSERQLARLPERKNTMNPLNAPRASLAGAPSALTFHFAPTSASWLNAVESFFSKMTRQRIRRGHSG
jgi:transposase